MQEVLDSVRNWSDTNKMKLNAMKTKGRILFCKIYSTTRQSLYWPCPCPCPLALSVAVKCYVHCPQN